MSEIDVKKTIWSSNTIQTLVIVSTVFVALVTGYNQINVSKADIVELKHARETDSTKIGEMAGDIKAIRAVMERDERSRQP